MFDIYSDRICVILTILDVISFILLDLLFDKLTLNSNIGSKVFNTVLIIKDMSPRKMVSSAKNCS